MDREYYHGNGEIKSGENPSSCNVVPPRARTREAERVRNPVPPRPSLHNSGIRYAEQYQDEAVLRSCSTSPIPVSRIQESVQGTSGSIRCYVREVAHALPEPKTLRNFSIEDEEHSTKGAEQGSSNPNQVPTAGVNGESKLLKDHLRPRPNPRQLVIRNEEHDQRETGLNSLDRSTELGSLENPVPPRPSLHNSGIRYAEQYQDEAVLRSCSTSPIPVSRIQESVQGTSGSIRCYVREVAHALPEPKTLRNFSIEDEEHSTKGAEQGSSNPNQVPTAGVNGESKLLKDHLRPRPNPRQLVIRNEEHDQRETGLNSLDRSTELGSLESHIQPIPNSRQSELTDAEHNHEETRRNANESPDGEAKEESEIVIDQVQLSPIESVTKDEELRPENGEQDSLGANSLLQLNINEGNEESATQERKHKGKKAGVTYRIGSSDHLGKDIYIQGVWEGGKLLRLDSCEFIHPYCNKVTYIRRQNPGYLFTFDNDDFLARVSFNKLEEIDFTAKNAINIKRNLINKLVFTKIITDRLLEFRDTAYKDFIEILRKAAKETAYNMHSTEDIFQIFIKHRSWRIWSNERICQEIINNRYISDSTKGYCNAFMENEEVLCKRNKNTRAYQLPPKNLFKDLQDICEIGITAHKKALDGKYMRTIFLMAPHSMLDHLSTLKDEVALFVSGNDIELFADLLSVMCEDPFLEMVSKVWDGFFKRLNVIKVRNEDISLKKHLPLINPVYFYLCKSFKELASEISSKINISLKDFMKKIINKFDFPFLNPLEFCLIKQCGFIYKLMNYFSPANNSKKAEFPYKFQLDKMSANPSEQTFKEIAKGYFSNLFNSASKRPDITEDRLAWVAIADYTISSLISKNVFEWNPLFGKLFDGYTKFLTEIKESNHESFRILTHSLVRFIAQTGPYFSQEMAETSLNILEKQIISISKAIENNEFYNFRDLINVYYEFWRQGNPVIHNIITKFAFGNFKQNMEEIGQLLFNIVKTPFCIEATSEELITYFRSVNDFLHDIDSVKFVWYVKKFNHLIKEDIQLINKHKESYEVLDPEKFIKRQKHIPRHYIIEIIKELLDCVNNLLQQKKWSNENNLNATSRLLSEIKRCFLYLKEQPDYKSFEIFKDETIRPFISVIENSGTFQDFERRIRIVGSSFWYLRKQNEIDVGKALDLYQKKNNISVETKEILRKCYNVYLEKFTSLIQLTSETSYQDKISFITRDAQEHLPLVDINKWDKAFKEETIPKLIASLAAVWSLAESRDLEGTGQCLKPHCIQVLCIFRLLSVDSNFKGIYKHLVQVLTGQGKSLILGLLSALLALLGKKVRVVCYSEYLATRDKEDFNFLFDLFGIHNKISYGTFNDMANELLIKNVDGTELELRELVRNRVLNNGPEEYGRLDQKDLTNSVLLIDEVDVFFSEKYYGSTYDPCVTISFSALTSIQETIWEMVTKNCEKSNILIKIDLLIQEKVEKRDLDFIKFNKYIREPGEKVLLKEMGNEIVVKKMSNYCLFEEYLNQMIDDAILVARGSEKDWFIINYRLNDEGYITYKDSGEYVRSTINDYKNIFNYFRLKKVDFDHKMYNNYGYLNVHCGSVSYAKLPEKYPIILGVSGTLTSLNDYERKAIEEYYDIKNRSIMPSFFGHTNLKFDKNNDVILENTEDDWLGKIYSYAYENISRDRSVIIFFANDIRLNKFKDKYFGKFDRLHVLTENTERALKEKYVDEAGICRTLTLGTAGMGRGTDFKSSAGVERAGGVHVIQSFLSRDPKEETQIKGRTARKDNQGSYQLVLCREHLAKLLSGQETRLDYDKLHELRTNRQAKVAKDLDERISRTDKKHKATMSFLESFFNN